VVVLDAVAVSGWWRDWLLKGCLFDCWLPGWSFQDDIEAFGRGFDAADDAAGVGFCVEAAGVAGGQLKTVEQDGGALDIEIADGQGVDDDRERDLHGFAVFEGGEFDVLAGDEVAAGWSLEAEGLVALMEAGVEVAPDSGGQGWCFAAGSVGLDVTAECVWHDLLPRGSPLILPVRKLFIYSYLAVYERAKYLQT
jgi:hypothetical protein